MTTKTLFYMLLTGIGIVSIGLIVKYQGVDIGKMFLPLMLLLLSYFTVCAFVK